MAAVTPLSINMSFMFDPRYNVKDGRSVGWVRGDRFDVRIFDSSLSKVSPIEVARNDEIRILILGFQC